MTSHKALLIGVISALALLWGSVQAVPLKEDAPQTYTVKKNDTLWDIANMFLEQPWLWPELWRTNTQIQNPHLIYPGDVLTIRYVDGEPVLSVERTQDADKKKMTLAPGMRREVKARPIETLSWETLKPYLQQHVFFEGEAYDNLPHLLGNHAGTSQFVTDDIVLSRKQGRANDQYRVVRKQATIIDMNGNELGVQAYHIADAKMVEDRKISQWLVKVEDSNQEARRGDRLYAAAADMKQDLTLQAAERQRGHVVGNLHQHTLLGKHDVVIVDIGKRQLEPGTVMGIYVQGPDIIDGEKPKYANDSGVVKSVFDDGSTVKQPAMKIGELVVFKTFSNVSYGIITKASELVKRGAIVAAP
ncbi:LysM peptidoglycan-binding domain-containing protein [Alteromonas halophila]|uniref:Peptidoglycan-binding protein n=1 Tax=Alteromonas halophila TaxID=516698 RepID=A0A918JRJ9_9ALTE|nr:LysM domain-containing protein [Alteromonas halophila]GGW96235.1 peptidoglycan-binding protein [Alteromonas halophila]